MREFVELGVRQAVRAHEEVIRKHGRDSGEQTERGHDQSFTDGAGDLIHRSGTRSGDTDKSVVDTPHRTEKTDERSRRTDRGEQGQAAFQTQALTSHGLAQGAIDEFRTRQRLGEATTGSSLVMRDGRSGVESDLRERFALRLLFEHANGFLRRRGVPEALDDLVGARTHEAVTDEIGDDEVPREHGHRDQHHEHNPTEEVEVVDQVVEAHLLEGVGIRVLTWISRLSGGVLQHNATLGKSSVNLIAVSEETYSWFRLNVTGTRA